MNLLHQIDHWTATHNPRWLVFFRAVLGLSLFVRGISFLMNLQLLEQQIESSSLNILNDSLWMAPIISWINILGGVLITLGLFTRISVLFQIPIVVGAIIYINSHNGIYAVQSDLLFSVFILFLLVVFAIEGGGQISMDDYVKKHLL